MQVEYVGEEGEYDSIIINGEVFDAEDGDFKFVIPKAFLNGVKIEHLHPLYFIEVCESMSDSTVFHEHVPFSIRRIDKTTAQVIFEDFGRRKYWDGPVGFKLYMETKRDIILERQKELGDTSLESYDDDGDYINLEYSITVEAEMLDSVIQQAEQMLGELEGAVDMALGSPFKEIEKLNNEADFTISILIPLLRKLGFSNVRYNHGKKEYGRDVIFSRRTEFDEFEHWGVQVKFGDVSGGVNSDIDELIGQAEDAFKMPFYDIYTRSKQRISKLLIVVSGRFKENAVEKIVEKIETHSLRNNIVFLDGEKISTLIEKFRGQVI